MSTVHSIRHEELLPAYALGALDGDELRELEAHLAAGCRECGRQIQLWQGDLEELAVSVPPVTPSETTRQRVVKMAAGAGDRSVAPVAQLSSHTAHSARAAHTVRPGGLARWALLAAAASLAIAAWSGWRQARLGDEVERLAAERDRLARQVQGMDQQLSVARSENQRMAESLAIITAPEGQAVQLAGLDPSPGASGRTFVDRQRGRAIFYASDLPALASDKTYQLWWIEDGKPVSAGTFEVDETGTGSMRVERLAASGQIQAWAVTIEPEGGVPQPTGAMVLKG